MRQFFLAPVRDVMAGLNRALPDPPWSALAALAAGFAVSWWIYVPVHELLHAFGCIVSGGSVERLEIDPRYGAALLQRVFPFVSVGSQYAGQLTGFDTHGSDLIYLVTDFAPFLLTIFIGVPLLRYAGRAARPGMRGALLVGAALPVALAPLTNVGGDYYEMGSILVTRAVGALTPGFPLARWRSDDLFKTANALLFEEGFRFSDLAGLAAGCALGVLLAFATYALGLLVARR